jgi:hypothetical protein
MPETMQNPQSFIFISSSSIFSSPARRKTTGKARGTATIPSTIFVIQITTFHFLNSF